VDRRHGNVRNGEYVLSIDSEVTMAEQHRAVNSGGSF
jgi:hypothetical protein